MENRIAAAAAIQSCPTLCDPIDGSPPGSPVPGILQARTLEWVAMPSPMHESEKGKGSHSVASDSSQLHGLQPTRLLNSNNFKSMSTKYQQKNKMQAKEIYIKTSQSSVPMHT